MRLTYLHHDTAVLVLKTESGAPAIGEAVTLRSAGNETTYRVVDVQRVYEMQEGPGGPRFTGHWEVIAEVVIDAERYGSVPKAAEVLAPEEEQAG